jgi:hypothetical protein
MKIRENTVTEINFLCKTNQAALPHHPTNQPDQYQQNSGHLPKR